MNWLMLAVVIVGFIALWKFAQRNQPVTVDPSIAAGPDAITFYWRPG